ncbi:PREDICTED: probable galacturonosyltransferase 6 isoform X2 [Nelumbo nucifera]|uniref:Hexosyltransferase n=2 Tax=Nelumbo nucifera TaxID=4432 RepID=A0A1U8BMA0_NELNU|nr:PREDICTED: probable galacturonosyltransferase 6 isoform X2 [Nelumbo nucifera]DAD19744.1 TPA_asm: hypothetical protein HUJ06_021207 [Nelumbo nucifera]
MKQALRSQRIIILSFLSISVLVPIVIVSNRLKNFTASSAHREFVGDLSTIKYRSDVVRLHAVQQETGEGLKEPTLVVYKDGDFNSVDRRNSSDESKNSGHTRSSDFLLERNGTNIGHREEILEIKRQIVAPPTGRKSTQASVGRNPNVQSNIRRLPDEKIREMKNQVIRAKAFLNFAPPNSNTNLVKELKLRIKEVERAVGEATKDSDLSRSAVQRMRAMENSLLKASRIYTDCSAMATKLRAMTYNSDEQLRAHQNQATYLFQLAARTTPKGLHCLSMRLTADYFALQPAEQEFPNKQKLHDRDLYHYAVFSDNVLACSVVVNSIISAAVEPEKIVFHIVTDALNLPSITMWFLLNPPGKATIEVKNMDDFGWLSSTYGTVLKKQDSRDPRYTSALNHLRFYLPDVFPELNKIVLLDHDVVVHRDLSGLWSFDMKGKVNGAVETCREGEPSFRRMDMLIDFSDPIIAERFDSAACTWAFGMNVFDLLEWRRQNLTAVYHKYIQLGEMKQFWRAGSLPLGLVTFYNQTVALDQRWHLLGLGYDSGVGRSEIERAAVIHYDGNMKPWLETGIAKYKSYWNKHVKYKHPYLQLCNIH